MLQFNLEQLVEARVELDVEIDKARTELCADAEKLLADKDIDVPTWLELFDIATALTDANGMEFDFTLRVLESLVTYQIEDGVLINAQVSQDES